MRTLNTAAQALLTRIEAGETIPAVQLVEFAFSPPERYTTAGHRLSWGGHDWEPLGLVIEPVQDEVGDMPGLTFTLPGVSESSLALALVEDLEGIGVRVLDALVDPGTGDVAQAVEAWSGELNYASLQDGPQAAIQVTAEHRGTVALRPKPSRYTDDEQQRLHPGDTCLAFDPATDAGPLVWPAASFFKR